MAAKFKKGDRVVVLTGKDKGKKGDILKVLRQEGRVIVQGVQLVKKHKKASQLSPSGIEEREASIDVSNVSHLDPKDNLATRVGFKTLEDGRKVRFAKRSGEIIDR